MAVEYTRRAADAYAKTDILPRASATAFIFGER
jgi:hypothetical protein